MSSKGNHASVDMQAFYGGKVKKAFRQTHNGGANKGKHEKKSRKDLWKRRKAEFPMYKKNYGKL
ncbi:hypothetical protein [Bacteroides sp. MSB163]|uniref:hypothetical protein n=1 Tax=Bacteroides maternus TaxID=3117552 RepID=UPI002EDB6312